MEFFHVRGSLEKSCFEGWRGTEAYGSGEIELSGFGGLDISQMIIYCEDHK